MTQTPPGWHPDPAGQQPGQPPLVRWWDGTAWTEHVAPAYPQAQVASAPTGPATPDGQSLSGWWWRVLAYVIDTVAVGIVANIVSIPSQVGMQRDMQALSDRLDRRLDADPEDTDALGDFLHGMADVLQHHALAIVLPSLLLVLAYHGVMLRWRGATLGKLAVGLRVRRWAEPGRLPWGAVVWRIVVQFALTSLATLVALASGSWALMVVLFLLASVFSVVNHLFPLGSTRRQALHDKAAGTVVVRVR